MASGSTKGPRNFSSPSTKGNLPPLFVVRSKSEHQAFITKALLTLEDLGQHCARIDAAGAMDAAYQIEVEALELGLRVVARTARALSTHAAELYLRGDAVTVEASLKTNVDLLSVLLLRVYLTGTDVEANAQPVHLHVAPERRRGDEGVH